jgi:hypothetical protein
MQQELGTLVLNFLESTCDLPRIKKTTHANGNFTLSRIYLNSFRGTFEACYSPEGRLISCQKEYFGHFYECNNAQIRQLAAKGDLWAKQ